MWEIDHAQYSKKYSGNCTAFDIIGGRLHTYIKLIVIN